MIKARSMPYSPPNWGDSCLEITPGEGTHPDEPTIIVTGTGERAWEIARRIEALLESPGEPCTECKGHGQRGGWGQDCPRCAGSGIEPIDGVPVRGTPVPILEQCPLSCAREHGWGPGVHNARSGPVEKRCVRAAGHHDGCSCVPGRAYLPPSRAYPQTPVAPELQGVVSFDGPDESQRITIELRDDGLRPGKTEVIDLGELCRANADTMFTTAAPHRLRALDVVSIDGVRYVVADPTVTTYEARELDVERDAGARTVRWGRAAVRWCRRQVRRVFYSVRA